MYKHLTITEQTIDLPVGKVVCVGQNYHDHIQEMGSITNEEPVLFMKPNTALCPLHVPFALPKNKGECHNEVEIAVLINQPLTNAKPEQVMEAVWGFGIGLDLTLRTIQKQMKELGRPWELSKSFDGSAPVSAFIEKSQFSDIADIDFSLAVNEQLRQRSNSKLMIHNIVNLLSTISESFTLLPGDIVLTGTPAGVAPLNSGDKLELTLAEHTFHSQVA